MEEIDYDKDKKKKKLKIVKGDHKNLKISDVKDNLTFEIEDNKEVKRDDIVIPENQNKDDTNN